MRNHRKVFHEVVDAAHLNGESDAERHSQNHQQRVDSAHHAHFYISVEHVAHEVDERNAGHDEQGASHERMPGRVGVHDSWQEVGKSRREREECGSPCDECGYESRDADGYIVVAAACGQEHAQTETEDGCQRAIEERRPVATELYAEAAAGKAAADSYLPRSEAARRRANFLQRRLVLFKRIVVADGAPCELAYLSDGGHVDAVLLTALELGERVLGIAVVHHEHVPVDVEVQVAFVETKEGCGALHRTADARGVGCTLHKYASGAQKQVELVLQLGCRHFRLVV